MNKADMGGRLCKNYAYMPFGREASQFIGQIGFSSECHEEKTRIYCYTYRMYCPNIAKWLSRDPVADLTYLLTYPSDVLYPPLTYYITYLENTSNIFQSII